MSVPIEESVEDKKFDLWVSRIKWLGTIFFTAFLTGGSAVMWMQSTFVRRSEFENHEILQKRLEQHVDEDKKTFLTKDDFLEHIRQPGHPSTVRINEEQNVRIRQLERYQVWTAQALYLIARHQGLQLPPPPAFGLGKDE